MPVILYIYIYIYIYTYIIQCTECHVAHMHTKVCWLAIKRLNGPNLVMILKTRSYFSRK